MTDNPDPQQTDSLRIDKVERFARNNRALLILAIVLSPLMMGILLYEISAELKDGKISASIHSRSITTPDSAKTLSFVLGIGGLLGLNKENLAAIAMKIISSTISSRKEEDS